MFVRQVEKSVAGVHISPEESDAKNLWGLPLRCGSLRMQCRTFGNGNLPLHPLSKSIWLGLLGKRRRSSAEFDVAGTKSRVLCGQRRKRQTAFAKVLQKLWVVTCDRNGGAAGSNNYQGRQSRRQIVAKAQISYLDQLRAAVGTN